MGACDPIVSGCSLNQTVEQEGTVRQLGQHISDSRTSSLYCDIAAHLDEAT